MTIRKKNTSPSLTTTSGTNSQMRPAMILLITAQLALAVWVIELFQLEPSGQLRVGLLWILPLFVVHALVPLRFRMPLLLAVTAALVVGVAGTTAGVMTIGIGGLLIGLCHIPIAYRWRLILVLAAALGLAALQSGVVAPSRYLLVALPLLGALFMFRLAIYLYDIRHEKPGSVTVWQRIGYFFLLPGVIKSGGQLRDAQ